jgi:hypothetical protein
MRLLPDFFCGSWSTAGLTYYSNQYGTGSRSKFIGTISIGVIITLYSDRITPTTACSGRYFSMRGGGVEYSQDSDVVKEADVVNEKSLWSGFIPSLFDFADEVKSEVASDGTTGTSSTWLDPKRSPTGFESGRGGALVTIKPPRLFSQLTKTFGLKNQFEILKSSPFADKSGQIEKSRTSIERKATPDDVPLYLQKLWTDTWSGTLLDETSSNTQLEKVMTSTNPITMIEGSRQLNPEELPEFIVNAHRLENKSNDTNQDAMNRSPTMIEPSNSVENPLEPLERIQNSQTHDSPSNVDGIDAAFIINEVPSMSEQALIPVGTFRAIRKAGARATGIHGLVSGKYRSKIHSTVDSRRVTPSEWSWKNPDFGVARKGEINRLWKSAAESEAFRNIHNIIRGVKGKADIPDQIRKDRVKEIDNQMEAAQRRLFELACEKDVLQERLNPLWNYSVNHLPNKNGSNYRISASREFNFPSPDMVDDYLDMLFATGRIIKMNHTALWQKNIEFEDEDEFPSFYKDDIQRRRRSTEVETKSGSWFLRNGLGEKIGETAESSAYKAVCQAVMSILARSLSALHGVNVMGFSDIRLFMEQTPGLPPLAASILPGIYQTKNYAQEAVHDAVRRGSKKRSKQCGNKLRSTRDSFIQRDAVVETLLSQSQIATPLLKLFPLVWQRSILSNIVTLVTAIMTDFCEGLEFMILGHKLSFSFSPITEDDILRGIIHDNFLSGRNVGSEFFEAAVEATAADVGKNLNFLDRWHERILGGGLLRAQISSLIARLVLTMVDDILRGAKMSLWATQAGGPRLAAALEYRVTPLAVDDVVVEGKT